MSNWFYLHLRALAHALRRLVAQPLGTLLSALVVGIALSLPGGGYLLLDNVGSLARGVSGTPEISLFLAMDAGAAEIAAIEPRLKGENELASYRFVPRDEGLRQLEAAGLGDVLGGLKANPLPDAFVLAPRREDPALFERMAERMRAWPKVAHVQLDSAWVKRFDAFLRIGKLAVTLIAGVFAAALVAATFNTIRLQIMAQAAEIEVARFIGATDAFIRRPFQYFGALQGGCGGLLAAALVHVGVLLLTAPVGELVSLYSGDFVLRGLSPADIAALTAVGAALGWLGAQLSVSIHLRRLG